MKKIVNIVMVGLMLASYASPVLAAPNLRNYIKPIRDTMRRNGVFEGMKYLGAVGFGTFGVGMLGVSCVTAPFGVAGYSTRIPEDHSIYPSQLFLNVGFGLFALSTGAGIGSCCAAVKLVRMTKLYQKWQVKTAKEFLKKNKGSQLK